MLHKQAGLSLNEMLLVMVIASSIMYMSIRMYFTYKTDIEVQQVQANVDAIFQAMSAYYRANCNRTSNAFGQLNPAVFAGTTKNIDIQNDLITPGYLSASSLPLNPVVNSSGSGYKGYVAQFNRVTLNRTVCTGTVGGVPAYDTSNPPCNQTGNAGQVVVWQAQVSVELSPYIVSNNYKTAYLSIMLGDCLSTLSGSNVKQCTVGSTGTFVVYERPVSNAINKTGSTYWVSTPLLQEFKQMYELYPLNLAGPNQYLLCN